MILVVRERDGGRGRSWAVLWAVLALSGLLSASSAVAEGLSLEDIWPVGQSRDYVYRVRGVAVGVQRNRMAERLEGESGPTYRMEHSLELDTEAVARLLDLGGDLPELSDTRAYCIVDAKGLPLFYELSMKIGGQEKRVSVTFEERKAAAIIEGGGRMSRIRLRYQRVPNVIEVNFVGALNLLLVGKPLEVGRAYRCYLLAPLALRTFNARAVISREETIEWAGRKVPTFVVEVADEVAWISPDGRILRLSIPGEGIEAELLPEPAEGGKAASAPADAGCCD